MKYNTKSKKDYRFDMKVCSVLFAKIPKNDMIAQPQMLLFRILKYLGFIVLNHDEGSQFSGSHGKLFELL